jgi:hypothetical protein
VRGEILERAEALGVGLKNRRIRFADDNNARDLAVNPNWKFSYRQGSLEVSGLTTKASDGFVRVFDSTVPGAMERPWVVHKSTIQGLTPNEIKQALNTPRVPDSVVDVKILPNTTIHVSEIARTEPGAKYGYLQVKVEPKDLSTNVVFGTPRRLSQGTRQPLRR